MQFIPLAESSGLIVPVGWWVMEEALGQAQRWHAGTGRLASVTMNVNVSAIQLREPGFTGRLKEIIREAGIDADLVCVELTESTLIDDAQSSLETVAGVPRPVSTWRWTTSELAIRRSPTCSVIRSIR